MKPAQRNLPEFVRVKRGKRVALVHPDFMPEIAAALLEDRSVSSAGLSGRNELLRCETSRGNILIRPYRRGGMVAKFLGDRYVLDTRPKNELTTHTYAWRSGVPTVLPLGAMWERSGLFVRGSFATLEADAVDLLTYLQANPKPDPTVLSACGQAIRAMHRAELWHSDLQVKNILIQGRKALLIDFDGADRILWGAKKNLARLKRSFIKRGLSLEAFDAIASAYFNSKHQHRDTEHQQ